MPTQVEKLSIALTPELAAAVRTAVESGYYASSSEVVREALRDWKQRRDHADRMRAAKLALLHRDTQEGPSSDTDPLDMEEVKRRGRARLATLKAGKRAHPNTKD